LDSKVLVIVALRDEQRNDAHIMLVMLIVAHVSMTLLFFFTGQGLVMTIMSLLGLKPMVEGACQLIGAEVRPGQA
jgi:hypothetical protein